MESVGFKEWALVCEAIGRGIQHLIIRKGGIAEGRAGFSFRHRAFFLVPTWFHEQPAKVRLDDAAVWPHDDSVIRIDLFARVEQTRVINDWEALVRLESLHIWQREVIRERFDYAQQQGVHVAFVRVFRLNRTWVLPNEPRYRGCRSWITLPEPPGDLEFEPVERLESAVP